MTGDPDKKFPHRHTHTQTPRAPGTSKSRLLYLSDTSIPGAAERRKKGWWRAEMEIVTGGIRRKRERMGKNERKKQRWKEGVKKSASSPKAEKDRDKTRRREKT